MWTLKQAARVWRLAAVRGAGAEHLTAIACLTEGWAGAEIRRNSAAIRRMSAEQDEEC